MPDSIGRGEFEAFCNRIYRSMDDGFRGVHSRLDTLNGRTLKGELERVALEGRINVLEEHRIDERHSLGRRQGDSAGSGEAWSKAFTKREYALMLLGFTACGAGFKVILWLLEHGWAAVRP